MAQVVVATAAFAATVAMHLRAQAPGELLDVTYLEVAPLAEHSAVALLRNHRDAGRQEPGNVGLELVQQSGRPDHFVILETWRDQASFDQHRTTASTKAFFDALVPLEVSPVDQRTFKGLAVGLAMPPAAPQAVHVVTHVDTIPNPQRDATAMLKRQADESRKEEGNVRFDVFQQANRSNHFTIVEVWKDRRALDRHTAAAHTKQYREEIQPLLGSPIDERLFAVVK